MCARQESIEVSLARALKLNQAGQVIGSEEAKTDPLHLSCEEQANPKNTTSKTKCMQRPAGSGIKHARRAGRVRTQLSQKEA